MICFLFLLDPELRDPVEYEDLGQIMGAWEPKVWSPAPQASAEPSPESVEPSPKSVEPSPASVEPSPESVEPSPQSVEPSPKGVELSPASVEPGGTCAHIRGHGTKMLKMKLIGPLLPTKHRISGAVAPPRSPVPKAAQSAAPPDRPPSRPTSEKC